MRRGSGVEARTTTGLHPSEHKSFAGDPGLEPGATGFSAIFRAELSTSVRGSFGWVGWGLCYPRSPNARDLGHPVLWLVEMGWVRVVLSHPFRKMREKDGATKGWAQEVQMLKRSRGIRLSGLTQAAMRRLTATAYWSVFFVASAGAFSRVVSGAAISSR
jgi:hypothetical protein